MLNSLRQTFTDIADSLRNKSFITGTIKPTQIAAAIDQIAGEDVCGVKITDLYTLEDGVMKKNSSDTTFTCTCEGVGDNAFYFAFSKTAYQSIVFDQLKTVASTSAFANCASASAALKTASFKSLKSISGGYAFSKAFRQCTNLMSVDFTSLETIQSNYACELMFDGCRSLTEIWLPSLQSIKGGGGNTTFLQGSGITEIHFLYDDTEERVSTIGGYATLWGLGAGTAELIFDLVKNEDGTYSKKTI